MNKTEEANDEKHYVLMVLAIIVTIFGVYYRFAVPLSNGHPFTYNLISNIALVIGVILSLKSVFAILK
jgi:hypothetical protein